MWFVDTETRIEMAERKRTLNLPGLGEVVATEVGFRSGAENWNEYLLDDGSVVKVKLVATEMLRLDGHHDEKGQPIYLLASTNVMAVSAPEELRRRRGDD